MSCKYKKFDNPRLCQITNGECQFLVSPYDDMCPILHAYPDFDKYWLEQQAAKNDGTVEIENIKADGAENAADNLNIDSNNGNF